MRGGLPEAKMGPVKPSIGKEDAMTQATRFTDLVGCRLPIQLAPIGNLGWSLDLQVAVARAGGHPVYPAVGIPARDLRPALDALARETAPFGVNFIAPLLDREALELAALRAPLVDFFYGEPDAELVETVHEGGALASWQVGSRDEAVAAVAAGCDLIVAQGIEAGGRIRGELPLRELIDEVLGAVEVPVLAAGGIASHADVAAAMGWGADGVRVGTRFAASVEANAHAAYKRALVEAAADEAVVSRAFAHGVPDFPHRVLRRSLEGAAAFRGEFVGEMYTPGGCVRVPRYSPLAAGSAFNGAVEATPFYAGRSVGDVRAIEPAAEIVADLARALPHVRAASVAAAA